MLVLFETAAGFAVFKVLNEKRIQKVDNLFEDFGSPESANKILQIQDFRKFKDSAEALQAGVSLNEGKLCKPLKKLLKKAFGEEAHEQLLIWDAKLGNAIKDKLGISCVSNNAVAELMRCIKTQVEGLIPGLQDKEMAAMSLGLAHNLARYKLKFSPDKVDTMIVQAVNLLDDIDKELNNYMMRAREWYGWHFPELSKLIPESLPYVRAVNAIGMRENAVKTDLSEILPEDIEQQVKEAAEISMGTEVTEEDMENILSLCEQVKELIESRTQLQEYIFNRMNAIAPNVSILVGEIVGARLISHAGSLLNLAKHPASTIQILGAEKALFRALKTRSTTPKFGLIYHAQMIGNTSVALKGKLSRMLAAKTALACRYDALAEEATTNFAVNNRAKLASRINFLESGYTRRISGTGKTAAKFDKYIRTSDIHPYTSNVDSTLPVMGKRKLDDHEQPKPKKIKVEAVEMSGAEGSITFKSEVVDDAPITESPKKKKKHQVSEIREQYEEMPVSVSLIKSEKKKKKKKLSESVDETVAENLDDATSAVSKKKKKKQSLEQQGEAEASYVDPEGSVKKKKKIKKEPKSEDQ